MRNLTIKREKAFAGCAVKVQLYIEDPQAPELEINGIPCRKLGSLKNGEERTFTIENGQTQVVVIADKVSKNFCNEFYTIPEGEEDVFLSGKNHFDPLAGNPFWFAGQTSPEALAQRKETAKKGRRILVPVLILCALLGALAGSFLGRAAVGGMTKEEPKVFSTEGMQITLTSGFREIEQEGYTVCYDSPKAAVIVLREDFSLMEGLKDMSLEEYRGLVLQNNSAAGMQASSIEGVTCLEHRWTNPQTNDVYYYFTVTLKGPDAFWLFQFTTLEQNKEEMIPLFAQWAESVQFGA